MTKMKYPDGGITRVYNFSAGPSALPTEVLEQAQSELLDWRGHGMSVMEISHRSSDFEELAGEAETDLRDLLQIPDDYHVLFLPGGSHVQFAMVPMNLLGNKTTADYINTGVWSQKAIEEAKRYCDVNVVSNAKSLEFNAIPPQTTWQLNPNAAYLHYASNETIGGLAFPETPVLDSVPLVVDKSSDILSEPFDVSRVGLIYASAQKNIGPSGLSIVIVRRDLIENPMSLTPTIFNYKIQAKMKSMMNTPPTFSWYLAGLVFKWLKRQGGLSAIAKINRRKAAKLYQAIDKSEFYSNSVEPAYRSIMNVPFRLTEAKWDKIFVEEAEKEGLANLKGHVLVGGIRASIYNAVPEEAIDKLIAFMNDFERKYC